MHLLTCILLREAWRYDLFFVDSLSTCIPILRALTGKRVVFYCHFPDKVLSMGTYSEDGHSKESLIKRLYRAPVDILEEFTTGEVPDDNGWGMLNRVVRVMRTLS
jgi:alpha-1,3/alpha-1,6-mannosyltransferase